MSTAGYSRAPRPSGAAGARPPSPLVAPAVLNIPWLSLKRDFSTAALWRALSRRAETDCLPETADEAQGKAGPRRRWRRPCGGRCGMGLKSD